MPKNKNIINKFVIISDIENLRQISKYLLNNFDKKQIKIELFYLVNKK